MILIFYQEILLRGQADSDSTPPDTFGKMKIQTTPELEFQNLHLTALSIIRDHIA